MSVTQAYRDGRYAWRCEDCSRPRLEMPHRGPRKSVCKACQNKRYRCLRGDALRERNRFRMRLRRTGLGRPGQVGTIAGPEQRCYPFCARPGPQKGVGWFIAGRHRPAGPIAPWNTLPPAATPALGGHAVAPTRPDGSTEESQREGNRSN